MERGLRTGLGDPPKSAAGIDRSLQVCCIHTDMRREVFLARSMVGVDEDFSPPVDGDGDERLFIVWIVFVITETAAACLEENWSSC